MLLFVLLTEVVYWYRITIYLLILIIIIIIILVVIGEYVTALRIQVDRQKGVIAEIAATITAADAGIENIKVDERDAELSTVAVELSVRNRTHLARVMRRLRVLTNIHGITRIIE